MSDITENDNVIGRNIEAAKAFLWQNPNRDALIEVVHELDEKGIDTDYTRTLSLLCYFTIPICTIGHMGLIVVNTLHDDSLDLTADDLIKALELDVANNTPIADAYLHVAASYFTKNDKSKARRVLRKGIEHAENNALIKIYYCEYLSFDPRNRKTVEKYLLPLLEGNMQNSDDIRNSALNLLIIYNLSCNNIVQTRYIVNKYGSYIQDNSLTLFLTLLYLNDSITTNDYEYHITEWGRLETESFYSGAPDYVKPEDNDIISYLPGIILPKILKAWQQDYSSVLAELKAIESQLTTINLSEYLLINGEDRALLNLLTHITSQTEKQSQYYDFWQLMTLFSRGTDVAIPSEVRETIPYLYGKYPCNTTSALYLKYISWWGKKEEVASEIIPSLYNYIKVLSDGDENEMDHEWHYELLIPKEGSKGPRPLPYFLDAFIESFSQESYPQSFCEGVWSHIVRPITVDDNSHQNHKIMQLVDVFDELLPRDDPLFVKGWNLITGENYIDGMNCFQQLLDEGKKWYSIYRNLSYSASQLNNYQLAYDYELRAHSDDDVTVPEESAHYLSVTQKKAEEHKSDEVFASSVERYYVPSENNELSYGELTLLDVLKLIALIEHFSIPGMDQSAALFSRGYHWFPGPDRSLEEAIDMISNGTAYITNTNRGEGLKKSSEGGYSVDFNIIGITPNIQPSYDWSVQLGALYTLLSNFKSTMSHGDIIREIMPILEADLILYAKERIEAYGIPCDYNAKYQESAQHCLGIHPLHVCYGIFYHAIEDAAAKQREDSMSNQHTINFALSSSRNKATKARELGWDLNPYDRGRSAEPTSAIIQVIENTILTGNT